MKNNTLAIALASLLVGGVAVAAFQNNRDNRNDLAANADTSLAAGDVRADEGAIPSGGKVEYAQVISVDPITEKQQL